MANKSNTVQTSEKKKKHDSGLSAKEKIFVHALRNLFDPKGKNREYGSENRKDFVVAKADLKGKAKSNGLPRATLRVPTGKTKLSGTHARPAHLPPIDTITKWNHPAKQRIRKKRESGKEVGSGMKKVLATAEKKKAEKLSPSAKSRAEKRVNKQRAWKEDKERKKIDPIFQDHSHISQPEKVSKKTKTKEAKPKVLPTLKDVLPKDVEELEVVRVWGGAAALMMLSKYQKKTSYPKSQKTFSWSVRSMPSNFGGLPLKVDEYGYIQDVIQSYETTRDYNKATKGITHAVEISHLKTSLLHDFKKLESVVKSKDKVKSTKAAVKTKAKENAHSRRLEKRRLARLQAKEKSKAVDSQPVKPSVKKTTWNMSTARYKQMIAEMLLFQLAFSRGSAGKPDTNKKKADSVVRLGKLISDIQDDELEFVKTLSLEEGFNYTPKFIIPDP
jgi:hypothetical protein